MNGDATPNHSGLILGTDGRRGRRTSRIARCAARRVDVVEEGTDPGELDPSAYDFVILNASEHALDWRRDLLERFDLHRREHRLLFHTSDLEREGYAHLFGDYRVGNVLACDSGVRRSELFATIQKMLRDDIFGLDKYLAWGAQRISADVRSSDCTESFVDRAYDFVAELGLPGRLAEQFSRITGEFLTNAIYHAPTSTADSEVEEDTCHSETVELTEDEAVHVELARDGERVGVSVVDSFGSLSFESLFAYLGRCFRNQNQQVRWDTPGAGLGLYQSFRGLSHLVVNLDPGHRTEVIGLLNIQPSYADFAAEGSSLNLFSASR